MIRSVALLAALLVVAPCSATTILYQEDFSGGAGTVSATSGPLPSLVSPRTVDGQSVTIGPALRLTVRDLAAVPGAQSFSTPDITALQPLVTLSVTLDGATALVGHLAYEIFSVEISTDGGGTWTKVPNTGITPLVTAPPPGYQSSGFAPGNSQYFTTRATYDLSPRTVGQPFRLRLSQIGCFGIQNIGYGSKPGFTIDDIIVTQEPDTPTGVSGTGGNTTLLVQWPSVEGGAGHVLWRSLDGVTWTNIAAPRFSIYQDVGIPSSSTRFYAVSAVSASGVIGPRSAQVILATSGPNNPLPDPIRTLFAEKDGNAVRFFGPAMTTGNASGVPIPCTSYMWTEWSRTLGFLPLLSTSTDELYITQSYPSIDGGNLVAYTVQAVQSETVGPP